MTYDDTAQRRIITELGSRPTIDPGEESERRIEFLAAYLRETGTSGYVLGISGGVDSTVAGRLAREACQRAGASFTAVRLPYRSQADEEDARLALQFIEPDRVVTIGIEGSVDALQSELEGQFDLSDRAAADFNKGNIKARIRMTAQYAVAGHLGALVIGTDQAAEAVMGFFTKHGDGACDVVPLDGLTKGQVREIGTHLGAPEQLISKVPTADLEDLRPSLPDEVAHGVTYAQIDAYLTGERIEEEAAAVIERTYRLSAHKRALPVSPNH